MSDAEDVAWLARFEYQIVTWSAPPPDEEEEPPGTGNASRGHQERSREAAGAETNRDEVVPTSERAFRNGPIEDLHAGKPCPTCEGNADYSRISDAEMRVIMKNAVNQFYKLLRLKVEDPDPHAWEIVLGERYTAKWDEPE
jgi:hypothetical protein